MIVDSHAHCAPARTVWRPAGPSASAEERRLELAHLELPPTVTDSELLATMDGSGVDIVLAVTPSVMSHDNTFSIAAARRNPRRVRAVVHVDPGAPDAASTLVALAGEPVVVGARVMILSAGREALRDAGGLWAAAAGCDLPVAVFAPGAADPLGAVARAFPELTLVIDHAGLDIVPGGPPRDPFADWDAVLALSAWPSIILKVSGLPEASGEAPPFPSAHGRLATLVERFGPERLMWGSNFPPVQRRCSYRESLEWISASNVVGDDGRALILGGTAARVYGLEPTT